MNIQEGKDTSEGGVSLLLVVLVIAVFVALAVFGLNLFTKGQNRMSQTAGTLDSAQFSAYDNKMITGDEVLSAVRTYLAQNIVIVVDNNNADLDVVTGTKDAGADAELTVISKYPDDIKTPAAYNVGLKAALQSAPGETKLVWNHLDGRLYAAKAPNNTENLALTSEKNSNIRPITSKVIGTETSAYFVESGANYYAVLINDPSTKTVNGICFIRQAT